MLDLKKIYLIISFVGLLVITGCSSSRHVPEGSYLLDKVVISINDSSKNIETSDLTAYLRQQPNHKMLWSMKVRLGVYNMSGKDTTKWWNKMLRKLGEPPVIYDSILKNASIEQLRKAVVNKGFLKATVFADTIKKEKNRKMTVNYRIDANRPYTISKIDYSFPDSTFQQLVLGDSSVFPVKVGDLLDRTLLEAQRELITRNLKNKGYYGFTKEFITFNADTTKGSDLVELTMTLKPPYQGENRLRTHDKYLVRRIVYITDYNSSREGQLQNYQAEDTLHYKGLEILYGGKRYLRPEVLWENCFIRPGNIYRQNEVDRTYQALSRLSILKFINIRFLPVGQLADADLLDAYILLTPGRSQSASIELEGTNSEGDLGVAASLTYTHRNIGKGSETFTGKLRGAYESLSGNLEGLIHDRYMEYSFETGLTFPKFKAPFLSDKFKRKVNASTELNVSMTYQERPEYTRIISTAGWSYKWINNRNKNRYIFTPIDINYVYLPESTNDFINEIAPDNPLLRYSYEDHFIMRMGFTFYRSNKRSESQYWHDFQKRIYTLRANVEIAGNLLFLINTIFNGRANYHNDPYKIFGIHYSQYFKINGDYTILKNFDGRNALAFHVGFGLGYPYANSEILPFEKRFYGGGANGVRGWSVRTLGPGNFPGTNSVSDFINQCGDIRFETSVEYRAKLFWILELGAFIDAGNIWTIHNYPNQPGGLFQFNRFYKEIAGAYGIGIRLDFSYFLLRFDLGMKAYNPAVGSERWPLIHPDWSRDRAFHFSIGYPF